MVDVTVQFGQIAFLYRCQISVILDIAGRIRLATGRRFYPTKTKYAHNMYFLIVYRYFLVFEILNFNPIFGKKKVKIATGPTKLRLQILVVTDK